MSPVGVPGPDDPIRAAFPISVWCKKDTNGVGGSKWGDSPPKRLLLLEGELVDEWFWGMFKSRMKCLSILRPNIRQIRLYSWLLIWSGSTANTSFCWSKLCGTSWSWNGIRRDMLPSWRYPYPGDLSWPTSAKAGTQTVATPVWKFPLERTLTSVWEKVGSVGVAWVIRWRREQSIIDATSYRTVI